MKENELRVGNWVLETNSPLQVDINDLHLAEIFDPIPLDEEWLVRFGLNFGWDNYDIEFMFDKYHLRYRYDAGSSAYITEIKYVHSLQNIYFCLEQKELEL